jgi:hypothetical protein
MFSKTVKMRWIKTSSPMRLALAALVMSVGAFAGVTARPAEAQNSAFWLGEYFNNPTLSGRPVLQRTTRNVAFNWGLSSPSRLVQADNFSARWTRPLTLAPGVYQLRLRADDGVRLYVDNRLVIDEWRDGALRDSSVSLQLGGSHLFRVEYYERGQYASVRFNIVRQQAAQPSTTSWRGEYYNNLSLAGAPTVVRDDADVNFDFRSGSPADGVGADNFSVRWTRRVAFSPGYYTFLALVDDGVRLFVGERLVIDQWQDGGQREVRSNSIFLSGEVPVRVEYYDRDGGAIVRLTILPTSQAGINPTAIPIRTLDAWRGEYYNNANLTGSPAFVREDSVVNFDFGAGSPDGRLPADNFSVRWTRTINPAPGNYRFSVRVDDGARLYVGGALVINAFEEGPPRTLTADVAVSGPTEVRLEYLERGGGALVNLSYEAISSFADYKGEYFNNPDLQGAPALVRNDREINFNFGAGSPAPQIQPDNFSARWTRTQNFAAGAYRLTVAMDDGARVYIDNTLVLNQWAEGANRTLSVDVPLSAGQHTVRVEYFDRGGSGNMSFSIIPVALIVPTAAP